MTGAQAASAAAAATAVTVRAATEDDVVAIHAIYAHHVTHGSGSFELAPPELAEMARRRAEIVGKGMPYLVAVDDPESGSGAGGVLGFAYAAPYRPRAAYRYTVEDSVYVADGWARRGIGSRLIEDLIARCAALGRRQMVAVIGDSGNAASIGFHARHGFRLAGTLPSVGFKFGRWVDSVVMVRPLGAGDRTPPDRA